MGFFGWSRSPRVFFFLITVVLSILKSIVSLCFPSGSLVKLRYTCIVVFFYLVGLVESVFLTTSLVVRLMEEGGVEINELVQQTAVVTCREITLDLGSNSETGTRFAVSWKSYI